MEHYTNILSNVSFLFNGLTAAMIPANGPLSVLDQVLVSISACFDTSEVRDEVVLLQHGQGGGVEV